MLLKTVPGLSFVSYRVSQVRKIDQRNINLVHGPGANKLLSFKISYVSDNNDTQTSMEINKNSLRYYINSRTEEDKMSKLR